MSSVTALPIGRDATEAAQGALDKSHSHRGAVLLKAFEVAVGLFLALVWLRSSAAHLANPYYFLSSIYQYELVGPATGKFLAMVLPTAQLLLAVCLVGRLYVGGALLASSMLLSVFLFAQSSAAARGLNISCGCFGSALSSDVGQESISQVALLLGLSIVALVAFLWTTRVVPKPVHAGAG